MRQLIPALVLFLLAGIASGQENDVLITRDGVSVTTAEVEEFLLTIPKKDRAAFAGSRKRLMKAIDGILTRKTLLRDARQHNVHTRKQVLAKAEQARQRVVIEAWIDEYVASQPDADYKALASEYYLANQSEFKRPERVTIRHLLISNDNRSASDAQQLAAEIRQRILEGSLDFEEAVRQYSEDSQTAPEGGLIRGLERGQTEASFGTAAFGLTKQQPLSEVVETASGSHLIKLVEHQEAGQIPFEEVETRLVEQMKTQHREDLLATYLSGIKQGEAKVNSDGLQRYLERKTDVTGASAQ